MVTPGLRSHLPPIPKMPAGEKGPLTDVSFIANEDTDYAKMCRYHQTSPQSHFTRSRICSRATQHGHIAGRITLSDMRFITTSKSGTHQAHQFRQERTLLSEEEYADLLRERFGIVMTS